MALDHQESEWDQTVVIGYATRAFDRGFLTRSLSPITAALVFVVLLGVVAAFVIPSSICTTDCARNDLARSAIDANNSPIATAIRLYQLDAGQYPVTLDDLAAKPALIQNWRGPYIRDVSRLRDPWGESYGYRAPGTDGRTFDLWSKGPDKSNGTEDDIIRWPKQ